MPSGVYKRSLKEIERTKKMGRIFGFQIGHKINLNRIPNKKTRDKMIESRTGKKHTIEHSENQSKALKGRKAPWVSKMNKQRTGKNHPNWKNGITPLTSKIRDCWKSKLWVRNVFVKDNFICQDCKEKSGNGYTIYLVAHHYPKSFSQIFHENNIKTMEQALECEEFWDINNGITLCRKCHKKRHEQNNRLNQNARKR